MRYLRDIFDDWITRLAGIIFVLIVGLVLFNIYSDFPEEHPLFGVINFSLVPLLFVVGGVVFTFAILKLSAVSRTNTIREYRKRLSKMIFLMISGAIGIMLLVMGVYQMVEFMDTPGFCGRLCHNVMNPEYTTYQISPHSRVNCVECHVGSGASYLARSKVRGLPQMFNTILDTFERPIPTPIANLRPAREICEACHRPEKFTDEIVRVHRSFLPDEQNTEQVDTRAFRIGGGSFDVASGIHWHIGANVWYLPLDEKRQEIGWVGVEDTNGNIQAFINPNFTDLVTQERIAKDKRLMDCIDCHNRATHIFYSPDELIDTALAQGKISRRLPFIKREGLNALDPVNTSLEIAISKLRSIDKFYFLYYPEIYANDNDKELIDKAILELENIARLTTFPDLGVDWNTHKDNMSHEGCQRCHSKLVAVSGEQQGKPINNSCTLCHHAL